MIIDCHVHLNHYADETVDTLEQSLNALLTEMRRNRVDAAMILTSYKQNPGRPSTRAVIDATRGRDNLHIVAGISYDSFSGAIVDELRGYLTAGAVCGLKFYPGYESFYPFDEKLEPVYALAAEFKVPVMFHSGDTYSPRGKVKYSHPLHIDEVAVDHPDVNFVICHLGNPWFTDCMEVVYKNANVYADISGLVLGDFSDRFERYMRDQLQEMLLWGVEPRKVLYGTDWPISAMKSYLEFVADIKMPPRDRQMMMAENAATLFHVPLPATEAGLGSLLRGLT